MKRLKDMKLCMFLVVVVSLLFCLTGCGRKEEALEGTQEPLSIEISPLTDGEIIDASTVTDSLSENITEISLPPQGPYKPSAKQIQTALNNAGYYKDKIDGNIGPLTKKAIKEFQAANELEADGKVGPKTWALLSSYLSQEQPE